ncbi:MAG: Gfo/Idh/MocA family oxidoreductase, partial [Armatimonadota bacterium]|nr:Gfo/Idh/MocA family oxidoreductase [Armatimonadota bacterium]
MRSFGIAVIGCGRAGRRHLEACALHPERVRVAAVCDPDAPCREEACARYGVPKGFSAVEELLASDGWEVAVVCTPTPLREAVVRPLAAAGKHVLVEPPLASTLDEARRVVDACAAAGVSLAVAQNFRYHYSFHLVRH